MDWISTRRSTVMLYLLFSLAIVTSTTANAQTWVASTGTVDESSLSTYQFNGGAVFVRSSLSTGTVVLRYNVLPVGDLAVALTNPCCQGRALWVSFLDNGSSARVLVKLKRFKVTTGQTTTLLSFDSNNFPAKSTFQQAAPTTALGPFFNFSFADGPFNGSENQGGDSVYYIEATLIRSASAGTPGLASVSIVTTEAP